MALSRVLPLCLTARTAPLLILFASPLLCFFWWYLYLAEFDYLESGFSSMIGNENPSESLFRLWLTLSSSLISKWVLLFLNLNYAILAVGFWIVAEFYFLVSRADKIKNGDWVSESSRLFLPPKDFKRYNDVRLFVELLLIDWRHCMKKSWSQTSTFCVTTKLFI